MGLEGKVCFVTGAANGIGRAVVENLSSYSAKIVAVDLDEPRLKEVVKELNAKGGDAIALVTDVSKLADVQKSVKSAVEHYGRIDVLLNNAGLINSALLVELSESEWNRIMDVNLKGAFFVATEVAKVMINQKSGRIINTSSIAAKSGEFANGAYCISKAGLSMMTQVLALELGPHNISVCSINPGYIQGDLLNRAFETRAPKVGLTTEEFFKKMLEDMPLRRVGQPYEIAELVAYLADEKSYFLHGSDIIISGGKVMH